MTNSAHVVLVDECNNILGTQDKLIAHNATTKLHRGFSVFLFNSNKELLIQRRSNTKKTWGGFWSNSFCGHPQIHETDEQAIYRHAKFELGIGTLQKLYFISEYRYKFSLDNILENEICPIYLAITDDVVTLNIQEVSEIKFLDWTAFNLYLQKHANKFTPWCKEEINILRGNKIFKHFID